MSHNDRDQRIGDVMLDMQNISLSFGGVKALTDISFNVREHEIRAIIGPNGAGKSSCYDAVSALIPRRGSVYLHGRDISRVPAHGLARLGIKRAFQQNAFFDQLTVRDNMVAALGGTTSLGNSILRPLAAGRHAQALREQAGAEEDREQFGVRQRGGAAVQQFFPRAFVAGPVADVHGASCGRPAPGAPRQGKGAARPGPAGRALHTARTIVGSRAVVRVRVSCRPVFA